MTLVGALLFLLVFPKTPTVWFAYSVIGVHIPEDTLIDAARFIIGITLLISVVFIVRTMIRDRKTYKLTALGRFVRNSGLLYLRTAKDHLTEGEVKKKEKTGKPKKMR